MDAKLTIEHLRAAIAAIENADSVTALTCIRKAKEEITVTNANAVREESDRLPDITEEDFGRFYGVCNRKDCPVCGGPSD